MNSINHLELSRPIIKLSALKTIIFSSGFVALAIFTPWLAHQLGISGQIFLPMHFFIFLAALLFGWPLGLIVGILSPLMSFYISGMPVIAILPVITIELAIYGFAAGILREKSQFNIFFSLMAAMIFGKIAAGLSAYFFINAMPLVYIKNIAMIGWPGILLQIMLIPFLTKKIKKFF